MRLARLSLFAIGWFALQGAFAQYEAPCNDFSEGGVEQALRADPKHERACYLRAMALIREAGTHDARLTSAERIGKTLRQLRPESAYAYIVLAEAAMRRRELGLPGEDTLQGILEDAERATRPHPAPPESYVTLGRVELLAGCVPCAARESEVARALGIDAPELAALRARIAEMNGDAREARAILERAVAKPDLSTGERAWLLGTLGEMLVRGGKFEEADRALANAIAARPDALFAYQRRAELRMFHLGDVEGALQVAADNPHAAASTEFKRVRDMARYLKWSRDRIAGRPGEDLRRVIQVAYLAPEDALVACARHPALAKDFELLLDAGLVRNLDAVDGAGDPALVAAVAGGNMPAARLLIERGANVNATDRRRRRAVTFAVERGDHELLAMLLRAGAEADFSDLDGRSPLLIAAQRGDSRSAVALLERHAARNAGPPKDAGVLLAAAATHGDVETLRALLDTGASVDAPGPGGGTALIAAVRWGRAGAARLLLERGADASRALEAAQDSGDGAMLELLRPYLKRGT